MERYEQIYDTDDLSVWVRLESTQTLLLKLSVILQKPMHELVRGSWLHESAAKAFYKWTRRPIMDHDYHVQMLCGQLGVDVTQTDVPTNYGMMDIVTETQCIVVSRFKYYRRHLHKVRKASEAMGKSPRLHLYGSPNEAYIWITQARAEGIEISYELV